MNKELVELIKDIAKTWLFLTGLMVGVAVYLLPLWVLLAVAAWLATR